MVQGAKRDLFEWFNNSVEEFQKWEEKSILRHIANVYEHRGFETEKKIFKYIARYVINRYNPPKSIDGEEIEYPEWEPLKKNYVKRKGHKRKYYNSGDLLKYLMNKDNAQPWYNKPKTHIDFTNRIVTYYSMFREGRKPFRAHDSKTGHMEESKIQMKAEGNITGRGGDNQLRPLFEPMENFLLNKKLNAIVDEKLKEYMEEEYENEQLIPAAIEF